MMKTMRCLNTLLILLDGLDERMKLVGQSLESILDCAYYAADKEVSVSQVADQQKTDDPLRNGRVTEPPDDDDGEDLALCKFTSQAN